MVGLEQEMEFLKGTVYLEEFMISEKLATSVIKAYDASLLRDTTVSYGVVTGKVTSYVVALNADNMIEYLVPIMKAELDIPAKPDYSETLYELSYSRNKVRGVYKRLIAFCVCIVLITIYLIIKII